MRKGRVLVTGGRGLVGVPLVRRLLESGLQVTVLDDGSCASRLALMDVPGIRWVKGDVRNRVDLAGLGAGPWSAVYHLAARASVPASVQDPRLDFAVNAGGTLELLEWAREAGVERFVYPSTVAVYDRGAALPLKETSPVGPSSPYGASKLAGEGLVLAWGRTYGLEVVVLRLFNVYGPGMAKYVIHDLVRKLQRNPWDLEILGNGEQVRDYVHVQDAVSAFILAAGSAPSGSILNLGSGEPVRIGDLADAIIKAMGLQDVRKRFTGQSWAGDIDAWYADNTRLKGLGWKPEVSLRHGLQEAVAWLMDHPNSQEE
ncbi:MAG: NAD-dependent epimerase/dehydratase family protein [Acidobacteriota bacterium]